MNIIKPTIEMTSEIPLISSVKVNGDSSKILFIKVDRNLKNNQRYGSVWIIDQVSNTTYQITHNSNVISAKWDLNNLYLLKKGFINDDKAQIYFYPNAQGDGIPLTNVKNGIISFVVNNGKILFVSNADIKNREEKYGRFIHDEEEITHNRFYYCDTHQMMIYNNRIERMIKSKGELLVEPVLNLSNYFNRIETIVYYDFIGELSVVITTRIRDDLLYLKNTRSYHLEIDLEDAMNVYIKSEENSKKYSNHKLNEILLPLGSAILQTSPDRTTILISYKIRDQKFYTQQDISSLSISEFTLSKEKIKGILHKNCLTSKFDFNTNKTLFTKHGIFIHYYWGTKSVLGILNNEFISFDFDKYFPLDFDSNPNGDLVLLLSSKDSLPEIMIIKADDWRNKPAMRLDRIVREYKSVNYHPLPYKIEFKFKVKFISYFSNTIKNMDLGIVETISWKSKDGLELQGVMRKPTKFDIDKKYPLVFIIHGGPTWLSMENYFDNSDRTYYPGVQFANNSMIVVYPNYRGSLGRGQKFMEMYSDNIGFGEMEDIESCIDYLKEQGFIDEKRIGSMGWSQGGYISAFLTTHSSKFAATSVGAGISSWYTYYISNDIRQWTIDYLKGTPHENPEYYKNTAPMNKINDASTPTLIQHGENDQRVPLSNAKELYRALKERKVPTELFIFLGMPHGITKPLESLTVLNQNLIWFNHWLNDTQLIFDYKEEKSIKKIIST